MPLFGHSDNAVRSAYRQGRAVGRLEATLEQNKAIDFNARAHNYKEWLDNFQSSIIEDLMSWNLIEDTEHARSIVEFVVSTALLKHPTPL